MASINPLLNFESCNNLDLNNNKKFPTLYLYTFTLNTKPACGILCDVLCQSKESEVVVQGENQQLLFDYACCFKDYSGEIVNVLKNITKSSVPRYVSEKDDTKIYVINDVLTIKNIIHLFSPEKLYMTKGHDEYQKIINQKKIIKVHTYVCV